MVAKDKFTQQQTLSVDKGKPDVSWNPHLGREF